MKDSSAILSIIGFLALMTCLVTTFRLKRKKRQGTLKSKRQHHYFLLVIWLSLTILIAMFISITYCNSL